MLNFNEWVESLEERALIVGDDKRSAMPKSDQLIILSGGAGNGKKFRFKSSFY